MWTGRIVLLWTKLLVCQCLTFELDDTMQGGHTTEGLIQTLKPASLLQCAVKCNMETECTMIGHYTVNQECSIYNTRSLESLSPDYMSEFYKASICDRLDYTYVASINVCVKIYNSWESYIYATEKCNSEGGATVFVTSTDERMNFMESQIDSSGGKYWVGGQRSQNDPGVWHWVNDDVITGENGGTFWLPEWPNFFPLTDCMNVEFSQRYEMYGYYNIECDIRNKMFICEALDARP